MQKKRFFLRQSVTLTGLSTESFDRAASACEAIYAKMSAHFLVGSVNHWENTVYEGHAATDFNARYFTRCNDTPNEGNLTFGDGVDPDGVLGMLHGHDLIHGPDNQVAYLKALDGGGCEYTQMAEVDNTDIYRLQVLHYTSSDTEVRRHSGSHDRIRSSARPREAIYHDSPAQSDNLARRQDTSGMKYNSNEEILKITQFLQISTPEAREVIGCKQKGQLKRKVLYTADDPEDETRGKMAKMQIEEQAYKSKILQNHP